MHQDRPAFRAPWTSGAAAYYEADSLEALFEGAKRKRKPFDVLVKGVGDAPCASCGIPLQDPYPVNPGEAPKAHDEGRRGYRVIYSPRTRRWAGRHYYCGWADIMRAVVALGR